MDQLGLGEEHCPERRSQTEGPHGHVRQPEQPALLTAEERLWKEAAITTLAASLWGKLGEAEAPLFQL